MSERTLNENIRRNVIVILNDSLRRDHVRAYGDKIPWNFGNHHEPMIETPNLDQLAQESALFERFYSGSFPTVPSRADLFLGQTLFPTRGWQPLEPDDVVLAQILSSAGWITEMIFDTPMLAHGNFNYHRGFTGWNFVRGQHADAYVTANFPVELPAGARKLNTIEGTVRYLRNSYDRRLERQWMCAKTTLQALDWLEDNYTTEGFFLWVDMWDPHEPFDPPTFDLARYLSGDYKGQRPIYPRYGRVDFLSDDELAFVRASYAAQVTLADRWVGRLLEKIDVLGLQKNTLVIYLTDHGHLFGDHRLQGKPAGILGLLYEPLIRVPLMIRHPDSIGAGSRPKGIAQHADILPTILDFLGVNIPSARSGRSLLPLLAEPDKTGAEFAFSGRHSSALKGGWFPADARRFDGFVGQVEDLEPITVTDEEWSLISIPNEKPELYNLQEDPGQTHDLATEAPNHVQKLQEALLDFLVDNGAPADKVDSYGYPKSQSRDFQGSTKGLADSRRLFVVVDPEGKHFAYLKPEEAHEVLDSDMPEQAVEEMSFNQLIAIDDQSLIHMNGQYYWARDLM